MSTTPKTRTRANDAEIAARVQEVMQARLNGAAFSDLMNLAAEKQWGVSERQLWRYVERADELSERHFDEDRDKLRRRHILQRRRLYSLCLEDGDFKAALSMLDSEAKLLDLFPSTKLQLGGKDGGPVVLNIVEEVVGHEPGTPLQVEEEVVTNDSNRDATAGTGQEDPPSRCPASVPPL